MGNRHERRRAKITSAEPKAKITSAEPKAKITFHTDPKTIAPEHMAIMLVAMTHAFSTGCKVPGVTFPIHISVQLGKEGEHACGTVEPSEGVEANLPLVDPQACAGVH